MAQLHNRISRKELKELIQNDPTPRTTISFYNYIHIDEPVQFRNDLYKSFKQLGVLGRIYIAHEGINAQVNMPTANFDAFKSYLYSLEGFNGLRLNMAVDDDARLNDPVGQGKSFFVLDVKVRKKIVADGIEDPNFDMRNKGRYVNAVQMNELMNNPDTIIIDMRNHYEYEVGHLHSRYLLRTFFGSSAFVNAGDTDKV